MLVPVPGMKRAIHRLDLVSSGVVLVSLAWKGGQKEFLAMAWI